MIKLFDIKTTDSYGGNMVVFTFVTFKREYSLARFLFSYDGDQEPAWPWIRFDCGLNEIFMLLICFWRLTFEFSFLTKFLDYD